MTERITCIHFRPLDESPQFFKSIQKGSLVCNSGDSYCDWRIPYTLDDMVEAEKNYQNIGCVGQNNQECPLNRQKKE